MGVHFLNMGNVGPTLDPAKPQVLIYERDGDKLKLAAAEWFMPASLVKEGAPAPSIFGQPLAGPMEGHPPIMPPEFHHYDLHVWLWLTNPSGVFKSTNPAVSCPKGRLFLLRHAAEHGPRPLACDWSGRGRRGAQLCAPTSPRLVDHARPGTFHPVTPPAVRLRAALLAALFVIGALGMPVADGAAVPRAGCDPTPASRTSKPLGGIHHADRCALPAPAIAQREGAGQRPRHPRRAAARRPHHTDPRRGAVPPTGLIALQHSRAPPA